MQNTSSCDLIIQTVNLCKIIIYLKNAFLKVKKKYKVYMYVHELILELILANIVFVACMSYV